MFTTATVAELCAMAYTLLYFQFCGDTAGLLHKTMYGDFGQTRLMTQAVCIQVVIRLTPENKINR